MAQSTAQKKKNLCFFTIAYNLKKMMNLKDGWSMAGSLLSSVCVQENGFLSSLVSLLIISPSPFLFLSFLPFLLPFHFFSFFQLTPRREQRRPYPSLLWLHMHNFKASF